MALFFVRNFDLPIRSAGALFGVISGASLSVGLLAGAFGTDRAATRDMRWWAFAPALALLVTPVCFVFGFSRPDLPVAAAFIALGCMGAMIHYGPTVGLIQNLCPVEMRASAAAIFAMLYALVGTGVGPTFVGFASDALATRQFGSVHYAELCRPGQIATEWVGLCASAARSGLANALSICVLAYGVAAVFYLAATRTLRVDLSRQF
jgi:hypothetical protein